MYSVMAVVAQRHEIGCALAPANWIDKVMRLRRWLEASRVFANTAGAIVNDVPAQSAPPPFAVNPSRVLSHLILHWMTKDRNYVAHFRSVKQGAYAMDDTL